MMLRGRKEMSVVITGIGITSSAGESIDEVEYNIGHGKSGISKIDYFDTDKLLCKVAGNLKKETWNKIQKLSEELDVDWSSGLSIFTIKKLIEQYDLNTEDVGLSLGTCNGGIHSLAEYVNNGNEKSLRNYPAYVQSKNIEYFFVFKLSKFSFNSACAASANAISYGAQMINDKEAEYVISGGCDPMSRWVFAGFNSLRALNSNNCQPYGTELGLNLGEGATYFLLEDKEHAIRKKHHIYAEVLGYGLSNDAYHPTAPDPDGSGITMAITAALKNAGVGSQNILYVNSHGTGTEANDAAEFAGIKNAFKSSGNMPYVSSVKGYVGHNLGAAASTELAITLIGLKNNILYPNYNLKKYRKGCEDDHILKERIELNNLKQEDVFFVNNNAAFGGQNVATVFRTNLKDDYSSSQSSGKRTNQKVFINNFGFSDFMSYYSNFSNGTLSSNKPLKEYNKKLYKRRMNDLTQVSIIAGSEAKLTPSEKMGLIYGTPLGSMISTKKYIDSIVKDGFDKASGVYFPDLVINSTAGHVCQALNLKQYSSSISSGGDEDLKSLQIGVEAIKKGFVDNLLVGAGEENSPLANEIMQGNVQTVSAFLNISNSKRESSIGEIQFVDSTNIKNKKRVADIITNLKTKLKDECKLYIQNNSKEITQEALAEIFNGFEIESYNESLSFSCGNFINLIKHHDTDTVLVGVSEIGELTIAMIKMI